jgi:ABC-type antimicrobial peptide transport system permease subunit
VSVTIRPRGATGAMTAPVRNLVSSIDPDLPIYFVKTLQERIDEDSWFYRVFGALFMIMGGVALVLAAVGLYGVMAFNVSRRTREMGVRMALGAQPADVVRLIVRQGMVQLGIGLLAGLGLAYMLGKGLKIILFQVSVVDPLVYGVTIAVLVLAAVAASLIPARRATRVDPIVALRYE